MLITNALAADLAHLALPAAQVTLQTRSDLGALLAGALRDAPVPVDALVKVAAALPYRSIALAQAHMAVRQRLHLAYQAGRAGYPSISQVLLSPLLATGTTRQQEAAQAVLRAISGPRPDIRLQITILETELASTSHDAESELLRLHHALAAQYQALGNYPRALSHAQDELALRNKRQVLDDPDSLTTRSNIAYWTGQCGDARQALRLSRELLPDQVRVLGPDHVDSLITRSNIAAWTGNCGYLAEALRLFQELLPDLERVLGPNHPDTLAVRSNIAAWTGDCGYPAEALRLYQELLPDRQRVLGPDHPDSLTTRSNIAYWTGQCGDARQALRLSRELLPDQVRVLGHDHPDSLTTRRSIAHLEDRNG
jgi:hypothetical protein